MNITTQVDGRFPGLKGKQVAEYLEYGWRIIDKTIIKDRYINYILGQPPIDPDVGKCSYGPTPPSSSESDLEKCLGLTEK